MPSMFSLLLRIKFTEKSYRQYAQLPAGQDLDVVLYILRLQDSITEHLQSLDILHVTEVGGHNRRDSAWVKEPRCVISSGKVRSFCN